MIVVSTAVPVSRVVVIGVSQVGSERSVVVVGLMRRSGWRAVVAAGAVAVVLDGAGGELHEHVLERAALGDEAGEGDAVVAGDHADLLRVASGHADGAAIGRFDRHAVGAQQPDEVVEAVGAHMGGVAVRHRPQVVGGDVLDQATPADDHVVLGHQLHLAHQVRRDEDGAALAGEVLEQVADPEDALGVEAVDRLVEHHDLRIAEEGAGDAEALAHAEREAAAAAPGDLAEADDVEHLVDPVGADAVGDGEGPQVVVGGAASGGPPWPRAAHPSSGGGSGCSARGRPSTVAVPDVGASRPRIMRIVVDLPAPFGPRKPVTMPGRTVKVRSSTARCSP